jgi:beta-phosphoglucomutase
MSVQASITSLRAVLWDLDGTIVDTGRLHWRAWLAIMHANGHEMTQEYFSRTFGRRNDMILHDLLGPDLAPSAMKHISDTKEGYYRELVLSYGVEYLPGVEKWLQILRDSGWRQAIASSAPRRNIEAVLDALHAGRPFDAIVASEDVRYGKPDPQVFLMAAEQVAVPPDRCIVVEDSPAGVEGAHRAGMRAIGVGAAHATLGADLALSALDELPEDAFERLLGSGGR